MKLLPYPIEYTRSDQQGEGYLRKKFQKIMREQKAAAQAEAKQGSEIVSPAFAAPVRLLRKAGR